MQDASQPPSPSTPDLSRETLLTVRTALVAGGTGPVGRYIVRALLDHGATVLVPSRLTERLEALRVTLGDRTVHHFTGIHGDLSDEATG